MLFRSISRALPAKTRRMRHTSIDPQLFVSNRERLARRLLPNSLAAVNANDVPPTNADGSLLMVPNSDLFYLTGIEQEESILLLAPGDADHGFAMRMFNSDGSEAETCLNGLRCVARAGFEALGLDHARVKLKTSSAEVARDVDVAPGVYTVRETAGPAGLDTRAFPIIGVPERLVEAPVPGLPGRRLFTAVTMPNPHLVSFVDHVDDGELQALGAICEAAPAWLPNRANVSFVEVRGPDLFVRTFERGVGLTDSCGSAMAASTYAACLTGRMPFGRPLTAWINRASSSLPVPLSPRIRIGTSEAAKAAERSTSVQYAFVRPTIPTFCSFSSNRPLRCSYGSARQYIGIDSWLRAGDEVGFVVLMRVGNWAS